MAFLAYILIFIILIVLVPVLVLLTWVISKFVDIKRIIFGNNNQSKTYTHSSSSSSTTSSGSSAYGHASQSAGQPKKKIIPKDEGEYVDFEEV